MTKISINENKLRQIVSETVRTVLSELDWRTYASAAEKDNNSERSARFRQAADNAFNRQNGYGLKNIPYGDADSKNMTTDGDFYGVGSAYTPKGDLMRSMSGKSKDINNPNDGSKVYNTQTVNKWGNGYKNGKTDKELNAEWDEDLSNAGMKKSVSLNPLLKMKQAQGDKQIRDFYSGKSKYTSGKGWS